MSISVVINTKNAASTLARALESVRWADEVVVMDMMSSDETPSLAKKHGAVVFTHPDVGYVEPARGAAIKRAKSDWVFILDADEEVPATLAEKVQHLTQGDATADAYYIPRKNIVFNEWYHYAGWWPDYQLRFFRRGTVEWGTKIHQQPTIDGKVDYLAPSEELALTHHNYQTVEQFIERLNRYTTHEVTSRKPAKSIDTMSVISAFKNELISRLFRHRGIDGGVHGVSLSFLQAMYELVVSLKQWQATDFSDNANQQYQTITALRSLQQDLHFWIADWQVEHTVGLEQLIWRVRRRFKV